MLARLRTKHGLRLIKRDGKILFDQLRAPVALRPFLSLPAVSRRKLQRTGLPAREWSALGLPPAGRDVRHHPQHTVWPMGFAWSSFAAQSATVAAVATAPLAEGDFVAHDAAIPPIADQAVGVATDDIIVLSSASRSTLRRLAAAIDRALLLSGILKNADKDVDGPNHSIAVGVELTAGGTVFRTPAATGWRLLKLALALHCGGLVAPQDVEHAVGTASWQLLLNRCVLALFSKIYSVCLDPNQLQPRLLSDACIAEFLAVVVLSCTCYAPLTAATCPGLGATDASADALGAVYSIVPEWVATLTARLSQRHHHVLLPGLPHEDPRDRTPLGACWRIPAEHLQLRLVFSIFRNDTDHINVGELAALWSFLRWLTHTHANHDKHVTVVMDNTTALFAAMKGRSPSWPLNRLLRKIAALLLCSGIKLHLIYTPSEWNPSDLPSRLQVFVPKPFTTTFRELGFTLNAFGERAAYLPSPNAECCHLLCARRPHAPVACAGYCSQRCALATVRHTALDSSCFLHIQYLAVALVCRDS